MGSAKEFDAQLKALRGQDGSAPIRGASVSRPEGWPEKLLEPVVAQRGFMTQTRQIKFDDGKYGPPTSSRVENNQAVTFKMDGQSYQLFHDPAQKGGFIAMSPRDAVAMYDDLTSFAKGAGARSISDELFHSLRSWAKDQGAQNIFLGEMTAKDLAGVPGIRIVKYEEGSRPGLEPSASPPGRRKTGDHAGHVQAHRKDLASRGPSGAEFVNDLLDAHKQERIQALGNFDSPKQAQEAKMGAHVLFSRLESELKKSPDLSDLQVQRQVGLLFEKAPEGVKAVYAKFIEDRIQVGQAVDFKPYKEAVEKVVKGEDVSSLQQGLLDERPFAETMPGKDAPAPSPGVQSHLTM